MSDMAKYTAYESALHMKALKTAKTVLTDLLYGFLDSGAVLHRKIR